MKRKITSISALIAIMVLGIGSMKGEADYPPAVEPADHRMFASAVIGDSPVVLAKNARNNVKITAYSSRVQETDDTPFITASGKHVRDGIVAANWLPFGTKVRIPELFGDRIFVVEDRMHRRNSEKLDIWFESTRAAMYFGVKTARVEIL